MHKKQYLIYKICHPKTMECVWVGMTNNPATRFSAHLFSSDEDPEKYHWVQSLKKIGIRPVFVITWWTHSKIEARIEESRLIGELKKQGHKLFNKIIEHDYTPSFRKPVKDNLGRVYKSMLDAEKNTGATRKGILMTIKGLQSHANGLKFQWANLSDLSSGDVK